MVTVINAPDFTRKDHHSAGLGAGDLRGEDVGRIVRRRSRGQFEGLCGEL